MKPGRHLSWIRGLHPRTGLHWGIQAAESVRYFDGTPIPSSLLLVIIIAVAAANGAIGNHLWLEMTPIGP
jgi:hypothetical protein